ncbi:hypothetical protein AAHA92_33927 [Salvia divinorum]|uniref:Uncharacterized protein n=1 Tax=Salvia divinorum TaxID=28513 RepID=A0ABD1FH88_SALDI
MSLIKCLRKRNTGKEDGEARERGEISWSAAKPNFERSRSRSNLEFSKKIPSFMHRIHNVESVPQTPTLQRSVGMRRDWSFEDLRRL